MMTQISLPAHVRVWNADAPPADVRQRLSQLAGLPDVQHMVVLPDVHLSGSTCVGVVLATSGLIYPQAAGSDLGCGILGIALDADAQAVSDLSLCQALLQALHKQVPQQRRHRGNHIDFPQDLRTAELSHPSLHKILTNTGRVQLGTLGTGNHFLEFQADTDHRLWLMIHSGSRGFGQAVSAFHQKQANPQGAFLPWLQADSTPGIAFLQDASIALRYAWENRLMMARQVAAIIERLWGATLDWSTAIHTHHDHIQQEVLQGQACWVHRKGAQRLDLGQAGLIPGSMGTFSVHIQGKGNPLSIHSCSHGAGRILPRKQALARISRKTLLRELGPVSVDPRKVDHLRDEAPSVYRPLRKVLAAQRDLVQVTRQLTPLLNYK